MQVHLIAIKICVVWMTHCWIQAECPSWKDSYFMCHHAHAMQAWLSVEYCNITIHEMAFDNISWCKLFQYLFLRFICDPLSSAIRSYDIICTRINSVSALYKGFQVFFIPRSDSFRHGKLCCNLMGNAYFIQCKHWIGRNHRARAEICSLSCQIMPYAP